MVTKNKKEKILRSVLSSIEVHTDLGIQSAICRIFNDQFPTAELTEWFRKEIRKEQNYLISTGRLPSITRGEECLLWHYDVPADAISVKDWYAPRIAFITKLLNS